MIDRKRKTTHEDLRSVSLSIAETFANDSTTSELATSLHKLFPAVHFVRASLRSGSGLFVTDNLLHQGRSMTNLVSFRNSLSAECMELGGMVMLSVPGAAYGLEQVAGNQISIAAVPAISHGKSIGAIIVGASSGSLEGKVLDDLHALAENLGEVLELVGQWNVSHMSDLLALREQDSEVFGAEEPLQDLPMSVKIPFGARREASGAELEGLASGQGQDDQSTLEIPEVKDINDKEDVSEKCTKSCCWTEDEGPEKPKMVILPPSAGVRACGISSVYIIATLMLMSMNTDRIFGGMSWIVLVSSILAFGSSGLALMSSKKTWVGDNADVFVAGFCVMKFLLSTMGAFAAQDDVLSLKHKLLQSMVVFESSLLLCMTKRSVSYGAHVAACGSLMIAMVLNV